MQALIMSNLTGPWPKGLTVAAILRILHADEAGNVEGRGRPQPMLDRGSIGPAAPVL